MAVSWVSVDDVVRDHWFMFQAVLVHGDVYDTFDHAMRGTEEALDALRSGQETNSSTGLESYNWTDERRRIAVAWAWPHPWLLPISLDVIEQLDRQSIRQNVRQMLDRIVSEVAPVVVPGENERYLLQAVSELARVPLDRLMTLWHEDEHTHIDLETLVAITDAMRLRIITDEDASWWEMDNVALFRETVYRLTLHLRLTEQTESLGLNQLQALTKRAQELQEGSPENWRIEVDPAAFHATLPPPPREDSKYRALFDALDNEPSDSPVDYSFADIDALLRANQPRRHGPGRPETPGLPQAAREHAAWWANTVGERSHPKAWLAAGYRSTTPIWRPTKQQADQSDPRVTFKPALGRAMWWSHRDTLRDNPDAVLPLQYTLMPPGEAG